MTLSLRVHDSSQCPGETGEGTSTYLYPHPPLVEVGSAVREILVGLGWLVDTRRLVVFLSLRQQRLV